MKFEINKMKNLVAKLLQEKYSNTRVIFLAGSILRGEGTSTSDLDIVVVYDKLSNAHRDSYKFAGWPIEAFVHDPETLKYFLYEVDAPTGYPSLASMVSEGIEIPAASEFTAKLKVMANKSLQAGPAKWLSKDIDHSRYLISDLIEDLKAPRNAQEMHAIASVLYSAVSNHYFRSKNLWSAKGKAIPRRLQKIDPEFSAKFSSAFDSVFTRGNADALVVLVSEMLAEHGGSLFEGYRLEAPADWRKK